MDPAAKNTMHHHCGIIVYSMPRWSYFPFSGSAIGKIPFILTLQMKSHLLFMLVVYFLATIAHKTVTTRYQPALEGLSHLFFRSTLSGLRRLLM